MASTRSRNILKRAPVVRAVIFHLLGIPASANAKDETTPGESIKTGDGLSLRRLTGIWVCSHTNSESNSRFKLAGQLADICRSPSESEKHQLALAISPRLDASVPTQVRTCLRARLLSLEAYRKPHIGAGN